MLQCESPQQTYDIKISPLHGYGLFAARLIKRGTKIGEYIGKRIPLKKAMQERYCSDTTYWMYCGRSVIDGSTLKNHMRYINHAPTYIDGRRNRSCNAKSFERGAKGMKKSVSIIAKRDIKEGEEILMDYGPDYAWNFDKIPSIEPVAFVNPDTPPPPPSPPPLLINGLELSAICSSLSTADAFTSQSPVTVSILSSDTTSNEEPAEDSSK